MAVSLILSSSVSYPSDTTATVSVTLKAKSTSGSYNKTSSSYGYIKINGTKYGNFSHTFSANTTTTLGTRSHSVTRTTATQSIPTYGWWHTDVSSGNISKSGSQSVAARPVYTVYFHNGYSGYHSTVGVYAGYNTTFPYISRTGYNFGSWNGYAQGAGTPAIYSNVTYTASWSIINYSITYDGNGGTLPSNPATYTVETDKFTLTNPTSANRTGYDFTGWTGTNGTTPGSVTILKGSTGNRTYTANWRLNVYKIKLDTLGGNISGISPTYEIESPNSNPKAEFFYELVDGNYIETSDTIINSEKTYYKRYYILNKNHDEAVALPVCTYPGGSKLFGGWEYSYEKDGETITLNYLDSCDLNGVYYDDVLVLKTVWSNAVRPLVYHYYNSATNSESVYRTYKVFNRPVKELLNPTIPNYVFKHWHTQTTGWEQGENRITELKNIDYDLLIESTNPDFSDPQISWYKYNDSTDLFEEVTEIDSEITTYYTLDYEHAMENPIDIYGEWNKIYTVNFFANSPTYDDGLEAQGSIASMVFENGISKPLPSAAQSYIYQSSDGEDKCLASGWSLNLEDNTVVYNDNYELILQGRPEGYVLNLYAAWTPQQFTITLDKGSKSLDDVTQDSLSGSQKTITATYYTPITLPISIVQLSDVPTNWRFPNHSLSRWTYTETNVETGQAETKITFPGTTVRMLTNKTYTATWVAAYHIPIITSLITQRYLDEQYTTVNKGGKYLYFEASGIHGSYDTGEYITTEDTEVVIGKEYYRKINDIYELVVNIEDTDNPSTNQWYEKEKTVVELHKYLVDIKFYDSEIVTNKPVATFKKEVTSETEVFNEHWTTLDKQLNMLYCILTIVDSTNYGENIAIPIADRTFTFTFSIDLERAIAVHIADDISAISMFKELEDNDKGLIINTDSINVQRLWVWKIDPTTQHMYLEWIGGN